jgi:pimeloyl-ACP methyl ester carboxylesterase
VLREEVCRSYALSKRKGIRARVLLACSEALQAGIPDARLVVFEQGGHAPFIEERDRFVQAVATFLHR